MLVLALPHLACQEAPDEKTDKEKEINRAATRATASDAKKSKTAHDLSREYGQSFSLNTEAMDYFFGTFFSVNFKEARSITSVNYRQGKTYNAIENEWRGFYDAAVEHGMNRKNLSFRTNPYGTNTDIGVVTSPSGRVIMVVYLAKTKEPMNMHLGWQVDDVRFFYEA